MSKVLSRLRNRGQQRVFRGTLKIHQLDSIPLTEALVFTKWKLDDSTSSQDRGCTASRLVEKGNVVRWEETFEFLVRIPSDPVNTVLLQPCVLRLSVKMEKPPRSKGHYERLGVVEVDVSETAGVGKVTKNYLLHESPLNATLKLTLRLKQEAGDGIFRRPTRTWGTDMLMDMGIISGLGMGEMGMEMGMRRGLLRLTGSRDPSVGYITDTSDVSANGKEHGSDKRDREKDSSEVGSNEENERLKTDLGLRSPGEMSDGLIGDPAEVVGSVMEVIPEESQHSLFEKVFDSRIRDDYPDYIKSSRVDAEEAVEKFLADEGLVELPQYGSSNSHNSDGSEKPNELNLENLLENRMAYVTLASAATGGIAPHR